MGTFYQLIERRPRPGINKLKIFVFDEQRYFFKSKKIVPNHLSPAAIELFLVTAKLEYKIQGG